MAHRMIPETPAGWAGYVVAALTILFAFIRDKRKGDVDESTLVLGKWKELVEAHERTLASLNAQIASLQGRLTAAEARIAELEELRRSDARVISGLQDENAGLKRAIVQNSQSTAMVLGRAVASDDADFVARLDRAGHNGGSAK